MDPGSPAGLEVPAGGVLRLSEATGVAFEHLQAARERTAQRTADVMAALAAGDGGAARTPPARNDGGATNTPPARGDGGAAHTAAARGDSGATNTTPGAGGGEVRSTSGPGERGAARSTLSVGGGEVRLTAGETRATLAAGERGAAFPGGLSTCVFGSWAREELTAESDDDWAVLVDRPFSPYDPDVLSEIVAAQGSLGAGDRRPGAQGVFGGPVCVPELAARIGLDADTNTNFTRRMLLLLESRELHGNVRRSAIEQILGRYLYESHTAGQPPRFLLNDVVRYWRTICVDFEGKVVAGAGGRDRKWASRNAKLRTSRKLLFAGGLVPVLLCHLCEPAATAGFLARWFDASPLDRISTAFLFVGLPDSGVRALAAYDRWIGLMSRPDVRAELDALTVEARDLSPLYAEIRDIGRAFEDALGALLFSSSLGPLTRTYAIF